MDTAVEAVEMREGAKNASGKVKFLSMPYKGMIQSAMIRQAHFDVKETKVQRSPLAVRVENSLFHSPYVEESSWRGREEGEERGGEREGKGSG